MKTETKQHIVNIVTIACAAILILGVVLVQHSDTSTRLDGVEQQGAEVVDNAEERDALRAERDRAIEMSRYWQGNAIAASSDLQRMETLFGEAAVRIREASKLAGVTAMIPE